MTTKETGGPAFPTTEANGCNTGTPGASLRDYFAGQALTGELTSSSLIWGDDVFRLVAENAYKFADAMLEARK